MTSESKQKVLSVSQLTAQVKGQLEGNFSSVVVEGEISSWSLAPSGHAYFSIKDEGALLQCVAWRSALQRLAFRPDEGMKVILRGKLSVFEKRGAYQLNAESIRKSGEGELWLKFQQLKARLEKEGLFATDRKRKLPVYPRSIGVVTSPTGAVIRDIINILTRRAPFLPVVIFPARVQGTGAASEIAAAVGHFSRTTHVDIIIVARGGGSAEDLWEFNDEALARAIFSSAIPVISAVGHETDFSISDFVADLRAPTPSAAAEIVSAGYVSLAEGIRQNLHRQRRAVDSRLREMRSIVNGLVTSHALRQPELLLREYQQRTDVAMSRMPELVTNQLERTRLRVQRATGALEGHNPQLILKKGYAIIRRAKDDKALMSVEQLKKNLPVDIELKNGKRRAVITDDGAEDFFA
ncbi:exodeoxyribonuclease VII large subunit [Candidatus Sumerlaeota bacterium]|nr:exodeoxyribonuclease VII large subunit [Candidatus Sumerlaeota bacterium]